jgi:hypothetical protein
MMALRDDELAAAETGIRRAGDPDRGDGQRHPHRAGGRPRGDSEGQPEPVSAFSIAFTLDMIVAALIGGISTIVGPIIGAVVIYVVRQYLQDAQSWSSVINAAAREDHAPDLILFQLGGATGLRTTSPLTPALADLQGINQHGSLDLRTNREMYGRVHRGVDTNTPLI